MDFIYWLLNVFLPIILLVYSSFSHFTLYKVVPYGKWTIMILVVYLMGWISWIFDKSYLVYFIDLGIKIAIPFLPININCLIETQISNLHLQIWFDQIRINLITSICSIYIKLTEYLLSKMETNESQQFKQRLIDELKKSKHNQTITGGSYVKQYASYTMDKSGKQSVFKVQEYVQRKQQTLDSKYRQSQSNYKQQNFPKFSYNKNENASRVTSINSNKFNQFNQQNSRQTPCQQSRTVKYQDPNLRKIQAVSSINKYTIKPYSSSLQTQVQQTHQMQQSLPKFQNNQTQIRRAVTFTQYRAPDLNTHIDSTKKPYKQTGDPLKQGFINKLDISSSEYSDMFDDQEQFEEDERILLSKVQVILEIGTGTAARLEIYNIELYSNRDLRIVSLYDREFETHKLHSMKSLLNGYYELIFQNGKIHSRKCKFRGGNFQPFLKYLV